MENQIVTNCEGCVFSLQDNGAQTGCDLDRTKTLGVKSFDGKSMTVSRFCNTYRPSQWLEELTLDESLDLKATVLSEVVPQFGFVVNLDTRDADPIAGLKVTMDTIVANNPAYVVVVTDKVEYNEEIWTLFVETFGEESDVKYHVLQMVNEEMNSRIVDEAFTHAQNGWLMITTSGHIIPHETASRMNQILNVEMRKIVMIEPYDDFNGLVFPTYLFKFLNGNQPKLHNDEVIDSRTFVDKIRAADQRSTPGSESLIFTWEEFFNAS